MGNKFEGVGRDSKSIPKILAFSDRRVVFMVHAVPDCGFARSYIISENDGLTVVDVGSVAAAADVASYIKSQPDMSMEMVRYITATHFHIDHIGGIGHFLAKCPPTTKVLFNHLVRDYLKGKRKISLIRGWRLGLIPVAIASLRYVKKLSHMFFESPAGIPLPGIRNMATLPYGKRSIFYFGPGDNISLHSDCLPEKTADLQQRQGGSEHPFLMRYPLGFAQWEVIETPGHTEDSVCFFNAVSQELIAGDLIVNMGKNESGRLNRFCWDKSAQLHSYELLRASIDARTIYPGHGEVISDKDNAMLKIQTFKA
jgi:glyoxylase-like metal-dependent hydrolase (beta-lactamase superfamily II)